MSATIVSLHPNEAYHQLFLQFAKQFATAYQNLRSKTGYTIDIDSFFIWHRTCCVHILSFLSVTGVLTQDLGEHDA